MLNSTLLTSIAVVTVVTLSACNQQANPVGRPMDTSGETIATVNNITITTAELEALKSARQAAGQPAAEEAVLDEIIGVELLRQTAVAEKLHEDPQVAIEVNRQATNILVSAYLRKQLEENPITDEQIQQEYDTQIGNAPKTEYKARHILLKTKEDATAAIESLNKGADFAELAKEKSTGPSGPRGGDLGWANPGSFVPEFSEAMQALEKGKYSKAPVETQFGWHIIQLEDTRETTPPALEGLKPQIQRFILNKRVQDLIAGLREKANVDIAAAKPEAETATEATTEAEPAAENSSDS